MALSAARLDKVGKRLERLSVRLYVGTVLASEVD